MDIYVARGSVCEQQHFLHVNIGCWRSTYFSTSWILAVSTQPCDFLQIFVGKPFTTVIVYFRRGGKD